MNRIAISKIRKVLAPAMAFVSLVTATGCAKQEPATPTYVGPIQAETFPLENAVLKNCRFKNPAPVYSFGTVIEPNTIMCDEGVARRVELLTPTPLPNGLKFKMSELALTGTANEKMVSVPYSFYVENEAGYVVLKISITVQ